MTAAPGSVGAAQAAPVCLPRSDAGVYGFTDTEGVTHLSNVPTDDERTRPYRLVVTSTGPAGAATGCGARTDLPDSLEWRGWVEQAARENGLEPALLFAVMHAESGFNARAVSRRGALGLMQLMPQTAQLYGVKDAFDARDNIFAGAGYLSRLLHDFGGDMTLALAAYNAGSGAVTKHHGAVPPFAETQAYVPRVLALYRRLGGAASETAP